MDLGGYKQVVTIYKITNKVTGHFYIGCTANQNPFFRCTQHFDQLTKGTHICETMQAEWNATSLPDWTFEILEHTQSDDKLGIEDRWIRALSPYFNGYGNGQVFREGEGRTKSQRGKPFRRCRRDPDGAGL